ncbi:MAG: PPC domain-containing protein [Deltaproteobacteria bacterium]|nr:PPC domain-containing protein [Deltaproteobacteria bacterium]
MFAKQSAKGVWFGVSLVAALAVGCGGAGDVSEDDDRLGPDGDKADTSALATVLDFEWDGELVTDWVSDPKAVVQDQLLFTIGQLNGNKSVGRLDRLQLTDTQTSDVAGGKKKLRYHAKMPVAWGSKTNLPRTYEFILPLDVSYQGQEAFTEKYKHDCVDWGAHDVDSGSMWYYYRPSNSGCRLAEGDVVRRTVAVSVSASNTTGKYPEYNKVWEDNALKVVAIFGKYEDGATTAGDAGIAAYNEFVRYIRSELAKFGAVTTIPAQVPEAPGVGTPDITFRVSLPAGKSVEVVALLVDNVRTAGPAFDARYEQLSTRADIIAYNGHAGLGQNVRALARKGKWVAGQYVIVFMNGCDTFAYVDGSLAETRRAINPDDASGSKYLDWVVNAMPAYFASDAEASMALIRGLLSFDAPKTYEQIMADIDSSQVVLVTGEQDNTFSPSAPPPSSWTGIDETVTVARAAEKRWQTPMLEAGRYSFAITGSGDADLYVRKANAPSTTKYDCRPYKNGSNESCIVTLAAPTTVHVMVRGYKPTSTVRLVGKKR